MTVPHSGMCVLTAAVEAATHGMLSQSPHLYCPHAAEFSEATLLWYSVENYTDMDPSALSVEAACAALLFLEEVVQGQPMVCSMPLVEPWTEGRAEAYERVHGAAAGLFMTMLQTRNRTGSIPEELLLRAEESGVPLPPTDMTTMPLLNNIHQEIVYTLRAPIPPASRHWLQCALYMPWTTKVTKTAHMREVLRHARPWTKL